MRLRLRSTSVRRRRGVPSELKAERQLRLGDADTRTDARGRNVPSELKAERQLRRRLAAGTECDFVLVPSELKAERQLRLLRGSRVLGEVKDSSK